MSVEKDKYLY